MEDENIVNAVSEEVVVPQVEEQNSVTEKVAPAQQTPEENAKFAAVRRDAETKARDKVISEMYGEEYGIHTYKEYQDALKEQERLQKEEEIKQQYADKGIPDDLLNEIVISKQERIAREEQKFVDSNKLNFLNWYQEENGRAFDTKTDEIPDEVWKKSDLYEKTKGKEGKSLMDAYIEYENKKLKTQIKAVEVNTNNAASSTGSVTGNGSSNEKPLTEEMVADMSPKELAARWKEVRALFNMK